MFSFLKRLISKLLYVTLGTCVGALCIFIYFLTARPDLQPWHTEFLDQEFSVDENPVSSFAEYLALEVRLFEQLEHVIHTHTTNAHGHTFNRYAPASQTNPLNFPVNHNRSYVLSPDSPQGSILLLHGMSDSPYSMHALADHFYAQGYLVVALRMPGHGTLPSGLLHATWEDMAASVKLAAKFLQTNTPKDKPFYIFGYSMGAAQAVNYAFDSISDAALLTPDALVLLSPAIRVSPAAFFASWQSKLTYIPGLNKAAWNSIKTEYDPYKYGSFAINAGDQVYRLTNTLEGKLKQHIAANTLAQFPSTLAIMSLVDSTVSSKAIVDRLLAKLDNTGNQLLLFDVNRHEVFQHFLKQDPITEYTHMIQQSNRQFDLALLSNTDSSTNDVSEFYLSVGQTTPTATHLPYAWPEDVYSLSHVALPFAPEDKHYGSQTALMSGLHIGSLQAKGERGVLNISASDMLRLRYNPFYPYMEAKIQQFIEHDRKQALTHD